MCHSKFLANVQGFESMSKFLHCIPKRLIGIKGNEIKAQSVKETICMLKLYLVMISLSLTFKGRELGFLKNQNLRPKT